MLFEDIFEKLKSKWTATKYAHKWSLIRNELSVNKAAQRLIRVLINSIHKVGNGQFGNYSKMPVIWHGQTLTGIKRRISK